MKKNQSGFTLIEIAIVMVIIGLLLGGVLKGQSMINSAKVRSMNTKIDGITAAWFAFQDRYRAFPGDMNNALAQIGPAAFANGNNTGTVTAGAEVGLVWSHLAAAGFISGSFSGAANPINMTCPTGTPGICPDNGYGHGLVVALTAAGGGTASHRILTGDQIPVAIVAELDRKIDDGLSTTGSILSVNGIGAANCILGTGYNIAAASNDCGLASVSL